MAGFSDPDGLIAGRQALDEQRNKAEALKAEVDDLAREINEAATAAADFAADFATAAADVAAAVAAGAGAAERHAQVKLAQMNAKIDELTRLAEAVENAFREHQEKEAAAAKKKLAAADEGDKAKGIIGLALAELPADVPGAIPVCPAATTSAEKTAAALAAANAVKAASLAKVAATKKDALIKRAIARIKAQPKFTLNYSRDDMNRIVDHARARGLDDQTIEDLIYIGSRNNVIDNSTVPPTIHVKQIDAATMLAQIDNFTQTVSPRGFPYRFDDMAQFQAFSNALVDSVAGQGLDASNIKVQGSSLRKVEAKDVDVAVFISKEKFAEIIATHFQGDAKLAPVGKKAGAALPLAGKSYDDLMALAQQIDANPAAYNAVARTFKHKMLSGLINSEGHESPQIRAVHAAIAGAFPAQNVESVSLAIAGGAFDLKPAMTVRKV